MRLNEWLVSRLATVTNAETLHDSIQAFQQLFEPIKITPITMDDRISLMVCEELSDISWMVRYWKEKMPQIESMTPLAS